ncbi:MAG TPA: J domain-containing protein [Bacilli bacterium]
MQDRRDACLVLGVPEEAKFQEIEDRYYILVKRYKRLARDEQPSAGEPIFAVINEAYRYLIGFTPMQKEEFGKLKGKAKIQYIREHHMMEMVLCLMLILFVSMVAVGIHELNKAIQAGIKNPTVSTIVESPHPISQDKSTHGTR